MNWDIIERSWPQYKNQIKAKWCGLTNVEIGIIDENRNQLIDRIRDAYCMHQQEADPQVWAFQKYLKESRLS